MILAVSGCSTCHACTLHTHFAIDRRYTVSFTGVYGMQALRKDNVKVVLINPGPIATAMTEVNMAHHECILWVCMQEVHQHTCISIPQEMKAYIKVKVKLKILDMITCQACKQASKPLFACKHWQKYVSS